jgi:Tfp pilus assembly PilM family ATPase
MSRWSFDLTAAPPPDAAVEIAGRHVAAAAVARRGGQTVISAYAVEPLPEGAVAPSLTAQNIRDRALVGGAVGRALDSIGRPKRVGLVVPDAVAKVSLVRFEQVPARAQDLTQLIRWQVRKAAPFPLEDAQVSFTEAGVVSGGREFLVAVAKRDVVTEYEALLAAAGAHAGVVDLSTFNVVNAVLLTAGVPQASAPSTGSGSSPAPSRDDWLLVNVDAADLASIAILRGPQIIFFRTRGAETDGTLADLVHQTAMYYEDRLQGGGFARAVICGASNDDVRRSLEQRLSLAVENVDIRAAAALTDRITVAPELLDALAPLAGLLLREGEKAA